MPTPHHPVSRVSRALLTTLALALVTLSTGASPATAADQCANAALRAQSNSTQLPQCRAYETVTPSYMEGFDFSLGGQTFSDDGNALSYASIGSFAGNPFGALTPNQYVATRIATGWTTTALNPPADRYEPVVHGGADALSTDLRRALWAIVRSPSDAQPSYYVREPDGSFTRIGQVSVPGISPGSPSPSGMSMDLSHVVFGHNSGGGSVADAALWEFVGTNNPGLPRRVSVTNDGQLMPSNACFRGMSGDGRVIVFNSECNQNQGIPIPLWARVGGSATVAISGSECTRAPTDTAGPCNDQATATYEGAAQDGSRVFFTTTQQLVNADTDQTSDLYACDIPDGAPAPAGAANPCDALTRVSRDDGARVENVAAVSEDGNRVYFVAQGVLADNVGTGNAPPAVGDQAHNLYLWTKDAAHPAGEIRFVTSLDDPALRSPQMTPDGRYLVFATTTPLLETVSDGAVDVYRYDAQARAMTRLSTSTTGAGGNGGFDASINSSAKAGYAGYSRPASVVTADGSMVAFETSEALSSADTNGAVDVYLWHEGEVSLISGGVGGGSHPWITPSGQDLFFATEPASSIDFYGDVYDARVGGGFDLRKQEPCSGDACQDQQSTSPQLSRPVPPSTGGVGVGEVAPVLSLRAVSAAQRQRLAATGKLTLIVTTNTPGTINVAATMVVAGKTTTIGSTRQTISKAGAGRLTLSLSKKARARLAARGSLTVRMVVSHSKVALSRSVTLRLTKAKAKAGVRRSLVKGSPGGGSVAGGRGGRS